MKKLFLDYETRSEANLKKIGAVKYAQDPTTEIMCFAYNLTGKPKDTKLWHPGKPISKKFIEALTNGEYLLTAHNAIFEQVITKYVLGRLTKLQNLPPGRWSCTAAKAASNGLPRKLESAALALGLKELKDSEGHKIMMKHTKPRSVWVKWRDSGKLGIEPDKYFECPLERMVIYDYCIQDVNVEMELDKSIVPLSKNERKIWILNQKMNLRGVTIDVETAKKITGMTKQVLEESKKNIYKITDGEIDSVNQVKKVLEYIQKIGYPYEDLRAGTVREALEDDLPKKVKQILIARVMAAKTSTKKYTSMLERVCDDSRVKDLTMYWGASTGRESGTGLQVQNLPKGKIKNTDRAIEFIKRNDLDMVKVFYKSPLDLFSACIRGMITASQGHELFVSDYNAIECRVLNWLARHDTVLKTFSEFDKTKDIMKCPYRIMAARILGKRIEDITDDERFLGKTAVLGCGYQMGPDRFYQTCTEWGVPNVSKDLAKKAVSVYRDNHQPVTQLWFNYEQAAIKTVMTGETLNVGRCDFSLNNDVLWVKLPSGRSLAYRKPFIKKEKTPWGEVRPKLYYWFQDSLTKKWVNGPTYGGLMTENISQAVSRDITMNGIMNCVDHGFKYLFQVHDEIVCESYKNERSLNDYNNLLTDVPSWAKGLPLKVGGWVGPRYKK